MNVLKGIEPERVFYYFNEISKIPHGSGNTKKISDFCVDFAIKQGLSYSQDEKNNVIIKKKKQSSCMRYLPMLKLSLRRCKT